MRLKKKGWAGFAIVLLVLTAILNLGSSPTAQAASSIYFPETGFTLSDQHHFLSYWQQHGGLAQFGYPLTPEITEVNPADQKTYIVQWFERNRFEYHPEFENSPYVVELGLLGKQLTIGRENEGAFRPFDNMNYAHGTYFAQTHHNLRNSFYDYWKANGGLAIYGYPISEEFQEVNPVDGKTYDTQWFERARFEYHPEFETTKPQYTVELGLLGDQIAGKPTDPDAPTASVWQTITVPDKYKQSNNFKPTRQLMLPPGFKISLFAADVPIARFMAISPSGDLFVTDTYDGRVYVLPDRNHDGVADSNTIYASGLTNPHGLAFYNGYLYVAEETAVIRYPYKNGDLSPSSPVQTVVADIPSGLIDQFHTSSGHVTRSIAFGPDGKMYVSIGSNCDVCQNTDPRRAAIMQYNPDGTGGRIYASGLRNAVGIAFDPKTNLLWASVNSRNTLGPDTPPDLLTAVADGGNYGWPYCYGVPLQVDNTLPLPSPDYCQKATNPTMGLQAHVAPLGIGFYEGGSNFPTMFENGLFMAYHGSFPGELNGQPLKGYDLQFVSMRPGRFQHGPREFMSGFTSNTAQGQTAWGRPVDVIFGTDNAMYVSDDVAGAVYRITYSG